MENNTEPIERITNHLGFLDGIRGGAAFYVMLTHCMIWGGWYWSPLPNPKIAVDIFMVLSGFLMVFQYRNREAIEPITSWRTVFRFWIRRFFRIAPMYYIVLIIVFVFWNALTNEFATLVQLSPERSLLERYIPANYRMNWVNVLVHITFLFGLLPQYTRSSMLPDWSISLEMQFYAAFPLLYFLLRRYSWIWMVLAVLALTISCNRLFSILPGVVPGEWGLFPEPSFLLMKLPFFLVGMLTCEIFFLHRQAPSRCALMTISVLLIAAHYSIWVSIIAGIMLWLGWSKASEVEDEQWIRRWLNIFLNNRYTKVMADCSYCVYLMHGLFISLIGGGYLFAHPDFMTLSPPIRVIILFCMVCPGTYLAAWLLHYILEKPGIDFGRRVINHWFPLGDTSTSNNSQFK